MCVPRHRPHEAARPGTRLRIARRRTARSAGRLDILRTARRHLAAHGRAACRLDELTPNTLPNRILKTTLRRLSNTGGLRDDLRKRVGVLHRDLRGITETTLNARIPRGAAREQPFLSFPAERL